jgi:amidase
VTPVTPSAIICLIDLASVGPVELHWLEAAEQAILLHRREISSVELVTHHLERIDRLNGELGAFITLTPQRALEQARAADVMLATDDAPIFCGVPTAFKDLTSTAGTLTTLGSRLLADPVVPGAVPDVDAHVVTLAQRAGLISLGKTNTPEFGLSSFTDNDLIGPARTPWDTRLNAGGSSGGAAAAVAGGLIAIAPGSDGGGSIRIPASCCGLVGFKPSRGRVSAGPVGSDWSGLAGDGPLARSVHDAAALLDVLARPMPGDIRPLAPPSIPFTDWCFREPGRLRVARWSTPYLPGIDVAPEAVAAWEAASRLLEQLGHEVVDVDNPFPAELEPQFNVVWSSGMAAAPIPAEAHPLLRPNTRYWIERGRKASAMDLARALQFLESCTREVVTRMQSFDIWLTPPLAQLPQPPSAFSGEPADIHRRELEFTPFTAVYNMTGVPAASLPLHWTEPTADRPALPVGVMLAGRAGADGRLFALLRQLESAVGGFTRHPSLP